MSNLRRSDRTMKYVIRIKGSFDAGWLAYWFDGFVISQQDAGETTLVGQVPDEAALHGLLAKIRNLGLELLFLERIEDQT